MAGRTSSASPQAAAGLTSDSGRRAGRRRQEALAGAARAIARRGPERTRFVDVSRASGVPVSTLQHCFGSLEALLVAAFPQECRAEQAAMARALGPGRDPWVQLTDLTRVGIVGGDRSAPAWRLWVESWRAALRDDELRREAHRAHRLWRQMVGHAVRAGVDAGRFDGSLDPESAGHLVVAVIDGVGVPIALGDPAVADAPGAAIALVIDAGARPLKVDPLGGHAARR